MLLRNLELTGNDRMLVNGSRGVITKFVPKTVSKPPLRLTDLSSGSLVTFSLVPYIQPVERGCSSAHGSLWPLKL